MIEKDDKCQSLKALGFKTTILGFFLLVLDFLYLPVYAYLDYLRTGGDGTFENCLEYAGIQPMPVVFLITAVIIILGAALFLYSALCKHNTSK